MIQVLCRYLLGFAGEVVSNASAVVENASFFLSVTIALHIEIYAASRSFPVTARLLLGITTECTGLVSMLNFFFDIFHCLTYDKYFESLMESYLNDQGSTMTATNK